MTEQPTKVVLNQVQWKALEEAGEDMSRYILNSHLLPAPLCTCGNRYAVIRCPLHDTGVA